MNISDLVYIDAAGYHYTDYPTMLTWLQGKYRDIYGADVYLGSDSQDGQFVAILAQAFFDTFTRGAATFNSFTPATAQGVGLSRIVKINGLERRPATHSTVDLVIVGVAGTTLTNAIAVDTLQQQWSIPNLTIPGSGTITVTATAVQEGAIAADPNTITGLFTPTQGWQTVNNPAAATIGQAAATDAQLRAQQRASVALPSLTVFDGTVAAVEALPGVITVRGYENDTNSTDGNGLPPHSIAIVTVGGDSIAIAEAIQVKKTPGTSTYGTTTEHVTDSKGMPLDIHFFIATPATIHVQVTINPLTGYVSSYDDLIKAAVAKVVTAPMVGETEIIGSNIILNQLYAAAYLPGTQAAGSFTVVSIEISKNSNPLGSSDIQLNFNEYPVCDPTTNVTVVT